MSINIYTKKTDINGYSATACNILLVSTGIISVGGAPESDVHETHYGDECFATQCQLNMS